jgi:hypothetical protein
MQNINANEYFHWKDIQSTVFHKKEILIRGSSGPGNMTGLSSDEVKFKKLIFFKVGDQRSLDESIEFFEGSFVSFG